MRSTDGFQIVLEYCEAGSLGDIIADLDRPFNEEQGTSLCHQVLLVRALCCCQLWAFSWFLLRRCNICIRWGLCTAT